jgi:hypothetical protein
MNAEQARGAFVNRSSEVTECRDLLANAEGRSPIFPSRIGILHIGKSGP